MGRKIIDLTGMTFGKLTVVKRGKDLANSKNKKIPMWLVFCSCNKKHMFLVQGGHLRTGHATSCERGRNIENLKGMVFGILTVVEFSHTESKQGSVWECLCECKNKVFVRAGNLKSGNTKSCGCQTESSIAKELKKYLSEKYGAIQEYKIIKNPKTNQWLRCDIFIPNKKVYVEVNGDHHYKIGNWHYKIAKRKGTTPEEEFEYQKYKDRIKKKYYRKNGKYIEIDLRKEFGLKKIITFIEKTIETKCT